MSAVARGHIPHDKAFPPSRPDGKTHRSLMAIEEASGRLHQLLIALAVIDHEPGVEFSEEEIELARSALIWAAFKASRDLRALF